MWYVVVSPILLLKLVICTSFFFCQFYWRLIYIYIFFSELLCSYFFFYFFSVLSVIDLLLPFPPFCLLWDYFALLFLWFLWVEGWVIDLRPFLFANISIKCYIFYSKHYLAAFHKF